MIWFFNTPWPSLVLCAVLYVFDYYLTIAGARLYRAGANQFIVFEGSYEMNPYFQADIDLLRLVSRRFVLAMIRILTIMGLAWWISVLVGLPQLFSFYLGIFVGLELAIQKRHVHNIFLFRAITKPGAASGQITYSRPLLFKQSAVEMFVFAGLFVFLAAFTWSLFPIGAAVGCGSLAVRNLRQSQKTVPRTAAVAGVSAG